MSELRHIPAYVDAARLCQELCVCEDMIDTLIARNVLPAPLDLNGLRRWKWSEVEKLLAGRAYFIEGGDFIKIGFTKDLKSRLRSLHLTSPVRLKLLCVVKGGKPREAAFHEIFAHLRAHGEWFRATPELRAYIDVLKARSFEVVE